MDVDVTQALKDTENALRDFISSVLRNKFGEGWIEKCGVSPERIEKWQDRKREEEKRQKFGVVEERLIYYADFYDLKTILKKHWDGEFSQAMGEWKIMEVWLGELARLRDPDAHRRELLPHQKHLALNIAGEIRTRLVRYRSKLETLEDYFPRIESARDNYGNIWPSDRGVTVITNTILRPDDVVEIVITASDQLGEELEYGIDLGYSAIVWQKENSFFFKILESHIGKFFIISLYIRSSREFHASGTIDDRIDFCYSVLPKKV
jgi:hypothetical protein